MKVILSFFTACLLFASLHTQTQAQTTVKLGHVNITKLLESLPDYQTTEKQLQAYAQQLQETIVKMETEYSQKVEEYYGLPETTPAPIKDAKAQEITDLEKRIIKLRASAEDQLAAKQVELLKPLEDKVMTAIKAIAAEKGYTYIFDSSVGSNLLYYPPADDITELVKTKLATK